MDQNKNNFHVRNVNQKKLHTLRNYSYQWNVRRSFVTENCWHQYAPTAVCCEINKSVRKKRTEKENSIKHKNKFNTASFYML